MMKYIHITTGDSDGIGLEVALKALKEIGYDEIHSHYYW